MNAITPTGFVYLISAKGSGLHKIGYATDVEKRLSSLQTGSGGKLALEKSWPGTRADEKALHDLLKPYRINGEWFRFPKCVYRELLLMDDFDIKAIRLPDYSNPYQANPIMNMLTATKELISVTEDELIVETAAKLESILDGIAWTSELEIEPEPISALVSALEGMPMNKRSFSRMARIQSSYKCFLHWRSIEQREEAKGGKSLRLFMRELVGNAIADGGTSAGN